MFEFSKDSTRVRSKAAKRDLGPETLTIESSKSNDEQRRPLWPGKVVVGSMEGRRDCPQLHDSIGISRHMQSDSCGSRTRDFSHCVRPCVFLLLFFFLLVFQFFSLVFFPYHMLLLLYNSVHRNRFFIIFYRTSGLYKYLHSKWFPFYLFF